MKIARAIVVNIGVSSYRTGSLILCPIYSKCSSGVSVERGCATVQGAGDKGAPLYHHSHIGPSLLTRKFRKSKIIVMVATLNAVFNPFDRRTEVHFTRNL